MDRALVTCFREACNPIAAFGDAVKDKFQISHVVVQGLYQSGDQKWKLQYCQHLQKSLVDM